MVSEGQGTKKLTDLENSVLANFSMLVDADEDSMPLMKAATRKAQGGSSADTKGSVFAGAGATTKNCTMLFCVEIYTPKRFVHEDLYASQIQKDPPDLSLVHIQIISCTKYKRNVTGICTRMHRKGPKMTCVHKSTYKSTMFCMPYAL